MKNLTNYLLIAGGAFIIYNQFQKAKQSTWYFEKPTNLKFDLPSLSFSGILRIRVENKTDLSAVFKGLDLLITYKGAEIDRLLTGESISISANTTKYINIPFSINGAALPAVVNIIKDKIGGKLEPINFKGVIDTNLVQIPINYNYTV